MSACRDHQVLFSIHLVCHRGGVSGSWQHRTPKFFPGLDIECPDMRVGGTCYEDKAAVCGDRTSEADRSRRYGTVCATKVLHRADRNSPADRSLNHVNSGQCAPRRCFTWQIGWRLQEAAEHRVRGPALRSIISVFTIGTDLV